MLHDIFDIEKEQFDKKWSIAIKSKEFFRFVSILILWVQFKFIKINFGKPNIFHEDFGLQILPLFLNYKLRRFKPQVKPFTLQNKPLKPLSGPQALCHRP